MPSKRKKAKSKQTKSKTATSKRAKKSASERHAMAPKKTVKKKQSKKKTSSKASSASRKKIHVQRLESSWGREGTVSARQSGDLQGLSRTEQANSESVDELVEEGNIFEAGAVAGVEEADDQDTREPGNAASL